MLTLQGGILFMETAVSLFLMTKGNVEKFPLFKKVKYFCSFVGRDATERLSAYLLG
jgi:hypothetical protein